jgi:hypothetical protein
LRANIRKLLEIVTKKYSKRKSTGMKEKADRNCDTLDSAGQSWPEQCIAIVCARTAVLFWVLLYCLVCADSCLAVITRDVCLLLKKSLKNLLLIIC